MFVIRLLSALMGVVGQSPEGEAPDFSEKSVYQTHGKMIEIVDLAQFENILNGLDLDEKSILLFDVDNTLLMPDDGIFKFAGRDLLKKLMAKHLELTLDKYYANRNLHSTILTTMTSSLVDSESVALVKRFQKKGVPTFAFTYSSTGKFGAIESLADLRINELKAHGFDFAAYSPDLEWESPKKEVQEFSSLFKRGVLFSSARPKGEVLEEFLNAVQWNPEKIVLIDDKIEYLTSVKEAMERKGIEFIGFHYRAVADMPSALDEKLANFQFLYLEEHGEWLSDAKAKELLDYTKRNCRR